MPADPQGTLFQPPAQAQPAEDLVGFRYCSYDVPFWVRSNARAQRWNHALQGPTQYWSSTPDGAWAEHIRFNAIVTEAELDEVRIPVWVCLLPSTGLLDLRDAGTRDRYHVTLADLTANDWSACQRAATAMRAEGARGVLSPSAALGEATNVTLFGPRRAIALDRRPALASTIPAAIVAIGRPPRDLVDRVIRASGAATLF